MAKTKTKIFENLSEKFEDKYKDLKKEFEERHSESLSWIKDKGIDVDETGKKARRSILAGGAAGVMLLSSGMNPSRELPVVQQKELPSQTVKTTIVPETDKSGELKEALKNLPKSARPLTKEEEKKVEDSVNRILGINAKAELDGRRLNTSYGYIGTESHLTRYPGDNLAEHFSSEADRLNYGRTGMAGGRGAYGYLASDRSSLTAEAIEKEKYYVVVQTFDSPQWKTPGTYQWFKHRKMLVINPENGSVVVGVIADAGPALSTGKQYGGSPEVIDGLGLYPPKAKRGVIFLFVDDPENTILLGPKQ